MPIFSPKSGEIAENCDHNIDPRTLKEKFWGKILAAIVVCREISSLKIQFDSIVPR
jgi:hypothetical protein